MKRSLPSRGKYWLNGLLLVLPIWFLWTSLNPVFEPEWPEQKAGPFTVALTPLDAGPPYRHGDGYLKDFSARFCQGCVTQIRYAWLSVGAQPAPLPESLDGVLHGSSVGQHVHAPYPAALRPGDRLWLAMQDWRGAVHHVSWPLQ